MEPTPPALEAWNINHWSTREVPSLPVFVPRCVVECWARCDAVTCGHCHCDCVVGPHSNEDIEMDSVQVSLTHSSILSVNPK